MNETKTEETTSDYWSVISIDNAAPGYSFSNDSTTGFYNPDAITITWSVGSTIDDVYDLFFDGKTIKENADEYMNVITRLPNVLNQLDAIDKLEFFRRQFFPESDEK